MNNHLNIFIIKYPRYPIYLDDHVTQSGQAIIINNTTEFFKIPLNALDVKGYVNRQI